MTRRRHVGARGEVGDAATGAQTGATQRRLLLLLCRGERTVNELAAEFGVTDNAVRAQLQRLARIGLVRQVGSRPGTRRPHADYELTVEAAKLFPTAYAPAVRSLVDVLNERIPAGRLRQLLLEAGRRLARSRIGACGRAVPAGGWRNLSSGSAARPPAWNCSTVRTGRSSAPAFARWRR